MKAMENPAVNMAFIIDELKNQIHTALKNMQYSFIIYSPPKDALDEKHFHERFVLSLISAFPGLKDKIYTEVKLGEGRADLVIHKTDKTRIPIELKVNPKYKNAGIVQTYYYASRLGVKHGFLVIFKKKNSLELSPPEYKNIHFFGITIHIFTLYYETIAFHNTKEAKQLSSPFTS